MKTVILTDNILPAADTIKSGGLVAVPTETVYGLSADGLNASAVGKIYEVKGRPETKPINFLVTGMEMAENFCCDIPDGAYALAERFWPGPLTVILKKKPNVPDIVTAGLPTVGVRCPDHAVTLKLITLCGVPLATPSANLSGMPSPKSCKDVLAYFDGAIPYIIDGGVCSVGIESTIVDMAGATPKILRIGGLSHEQIEDTLGRKVIV